MNVEALGKLTPGLTINLGVFIFSFLCPGFLLWYIYYPELVKEFDFLKLCLLSVAVSSPTFVIPYALTAAMHRILIVQGVKGIEMYGDYVDWYLRHGLVNALNMYVIVAASFAFGMSRLGLLCVVAGIVLIGVVMEFVLCRAFLRDPEKAGVVYFKRPKD